VSVVVADFNGDGIPDLAVPTNGPNPDAQGAVSIMLGKGDSTFQPAQSYPASYYLRSIAVGDFNGDGHLDLVLGGSDINGQAAVSVLLGNGDGAFQLAQSYAVAYDGYVAVADFNGDGHPGELQDEIVEPVAPRFNSATRLHVDVKPGGATGNFAVTSK
jgi:hypothetical protein